MQIVSWRLYVVFFFNFGFLSTRSVEQSQGTRWRFNNGAIIRSRKDKARVTTSNLIGQEIWKSQHKDNKFLAV